jgi:hypothetical protein
MTWGLCLSFSFPLSFLSLEDLEDLEDLEAVFVFVFVFFFFVFSLPGGLGEL